MVGHRHWPACAPDLTDYTFASVIGGAEAAVRPRGYFLMSTSAPDPETFASLVSELAGSWHIEGIMVINPFADDRHLYLPTDIPTVLVGARPRAGIADSVALDDVEAGRMATQHLVRLGHRRIATITGPLVEDCAQDRLAGYEHLMKLESLDLDPVLVLEGDWSANSGYQALLQIVEDDVQPTAIFVQNDQMAVGVLHAARDVGFRVPEQLSVIGVDDIPLASHFEPPLTTVHQDFAEIGRQAARLLIRAMDDLQAVPEHVRLMPRLVLRKSTAPCQKQVASHGPPASTFLNARLVHYEA